MTLLSLTPQKSFAQAPQTTTPRDTNGFGIIKGTVVDPRGKPVRDATVYADSNDDRPMGGRLYLPSTSTNNAGDFVLEQVIPDKRVRIYAFKERDYYENVGNPFIFHLPKNLKIPVVEVKPGQTVTGVIFRLPKKVGKLHLSVRDADTKEMVHGIFIQLCRRDDPNRCSGDSGPSDYERTMSLGVGISFQVEADDGLHEKWEYRDPKTGARYFTAKSGKTETVNVYLRKK